VSNPLKYVTSTPTGTLRHANLGAGVSSIQYDETFNSGLNPSDLTTYYLVYEPVEGAAVRIYAPANAAELIQLAQSKGSTETTEAGALAWLSDNGYYPANKTLDNIVTDGLVLFIDSSTLTSYPGSGTDILDLSGTGADWTIPSDVFNSSTGVFNYASDQSSKSPPSAWQSTTDQTVEVLYKPNTGGIYTGCCDTIFGRYDFRFFQIGVSLYAMIGFDDGNGTRIYQHPAYSVSYDRWHHILAIRRDNRYIIWIDGVEMYNTTYGTGLALWDPTETYYISSTRHTNVDFAACRVYDKGLSDSEILQNYFQGPIVADDLKFAIDASNLSSFEPETTAAYTLTGSVAAGNGVLTNGVDYSNSGNGTWDLDGVDDFISISTYTFGNGNWTVSMWVNADDIGSPNLLSNTSGGPVTNAFGFGSSKIHYRNYDGAWQTHNGNTTLTTGRWYHLTWVNYAGASSALGTMKMYVDGVADSSVFNSYTTNGGPCNGIGSSWFNKFNGRISSCHFYDESLTDVQIQQNYNANVKKFT